MTPSEAAGELPCIERPELGIFDHDGDGVLSVREVRDAAVHNAQLHDIASTMEAKGIAGIRYIRCGDISGSDDNSEATHPAGSDEDIARNIARAALSG